MGAGTGLYNIILEEEKKKEKLLFKTEESLYKYSTTNTVVQYLLYLNLASTVILVSLYYM